MRARNGKCECSDRFTCAICFRDAGPTTTIGTVPTHDVYVPVLGRCVRISANTLKGAENIARHRTRSGKFDFQYLT